MVKKRVLITGANGFVGSHLCEYLEFRDIKVVRSHRGNAGGLDSFSIDLDDKNADWNSALKNCDCVVHLGSRVHLINDNEYDSYRRTNVMGTKNLAQQAVIANVKRFIFISSIGVNGAQTFGVPYNVKSIEDPHSPYAKSKCEAEIELRKIMKNSHTEFVIIRAPAIYGVDAPGNFGTIQKLLKNGIPIPFGAIKNKRSFLSLDNLVDLIFICVNHPLAKNKTFLASDGQDLSTAEIIVIMAKLVEKKARLISFPPFLIRLALFVFRRSSVAQSLLGDLQIDSKEMFDLLDWKPPFSPLLYLKRQS